MPNTKHAPRHYHRRQLPYTMAKQVSFDLFAKGLYVIVGNLGVDTSNVHFIVMVVSAFLASILACLASQPGDVLLTRSALDNDDDDDIEGSFNQHLRAILDEKGWKGLFSGLPARILHVGSIITSQLVVYDLVKQAVGLPLTGAGASKR